MEPKHVFDVDSASDFHTKLVGLLKEYNLHDEPAKINLRTPKLSFNFNSNLANCSKACLRRAVVTRPDGTVYIKVWCAC